MIQDAGTPDWKRAIENARLPFGERRGGDAPGKGKLPYGDVAYADPGYQKDGQKRYPIDTKEHVLAALRYIGHAKDAGEYSPEQLAEVKGRIHAAAKKFGIDVEKENGGE